MYLAHPRPLRPLARSSSPAPQPTSSEVESADSITSSDNNSHKAVAVGDEGTQQQQPSHTASTALLKRPSGSPPQARRTFSAPVPSKPSAFTPFPLSSKPQAMGHDLARVEKVEGDAWAWDEFRSILSSSQHAHSHSNALATSQLQTIPSSHSPVTFSSGTTTVLLPSASNPSSSHPYTFPATGFGSAVPPRTPSRASARSRNSQHHQRRRSSASASTGGSSGSPVGASTSGEGYEPGAREVVILGAMGGGGLGLQQGSLRVKTPSKVVGWDGEWYSPPSRALTRNPLASALSPSRLALAGNLGRLHAHSAYPIMLEHEPEIKTAMGEIGETGRVGPGEEQVGVEEGAVGKMDGQEKKGEGSTEVALQKREG
ncbi:hypothetical protein JCM11641_004970 [Rhodosporidiobolus odoratus]